MRVLRNRSVCSYGKCGSHTKKNSRYRKVSRAGMIHRTTTGTTAPSGIEISDRQTPTRAAQLCLAKQTAVVAVGGCIPSEAALEGTRELHPAGQCDEHQDDIAGEPFDRQRRQRTLRREVRVPIGVGVGVMAQVARPVAGRSSRESVARRCCRRSCPTAHTSGRGC